MTLQQFIGRDDPAGLSRAFVEGKVFGYAKEMSDLFRQKQGYVIPGSY